METKKMTEAQMIEEINKLQKSPYVKLAKQTQNSMLRQKLYQLRSLDKKGRALAQALEIHMEE